MKRKARPIEELQAAIGPDFQVKRLLGEGSSAAVYQGYEPGLGRPVAIKVPHRGSRSSDPDHHQFEREAKALASLEHPNVARAYHFGLLTDGDPYLVMALIRGRTMEDRLAAEGPLPPDMVLSVLKDAAAALAAAHERNIIHRDVRPGNILWDREKHRALLIDFGVATLMRTDGMDTTTLTPSGARINISRYVAPEILADEEETWAVDIYALGVTGYELLTGEGPFGEGSVRELFQAALEGEPRDLAALCPELDPNVAAAIRRCLNRKPTQRPAASDFGRALRGEWQVDSGSGFQALLTRWGLGDPPKIVGAAFVCAGFLVGGVATLDEQYDGLLPEWAFTLALVTGAMMLLSAAVFDWYQDRPSSLSKRRWDRLIMAGLALAWLAAAFVIVVYMG